MTVFGTLPAGVHDQRTRVRLVAYGGATVLLLSSTLTGHLDRPVLPLLLAIGGLVFVLPGVRRQSMAFALAVGFDTLTVLTLALITGSPAFGGMALGVAALILSIGKPPSTIVGVGAIAIVAMVLLMLIEKGHLPTPEVIPVLTPPADTVAGLSMAMIVALAGVGGVRRLLDSYGLAAARVEDSTRRWWRFMDQSDQPMLVTTDDRVVHANSAAESLTRLPSSALNGMELRRLVGEGSRIRRPDDAEIDVDVVTAPIVIDGRLSEVVFLREVTGNHKELRALERAVRDTGQFVATVSHEVRTPLTAVVGLSSVVDEGWEELSDKDRRELINLIAEQSREVAAIIEDLLVTARWRTVGLRVERKPVSLGDEARAVLASLGHTHMAIDSTAETVAEADPGRVRQILRNLLTNAVRYGEDPIGVSIEASAGVATIEVSDAGQAIPEGVRERIFEPFARADDDGPIESVGLGLSVSRHLAELMGGSLTYTHSGGRSRFRLTLPASP